MSQAIRTRYTSEAAALIHRLHPEIKQQIWKGIRDLLEDPLQGHELRFDLSGFRSYRIKSYRIVYQHNELENFIEVYYVGHRRDVYESFRSLLLDKEASH